MQATKPSDLDTLDAVERHTSRAYALSTILYDGSDALAEQSKQTKDMIGVLLHEELGRAHAANNKLYKLRMAE